MKKLRISLLGLLLALALCCCALAESLPAEDAIPESEVFELGGGRAVLAPTSLSAGFSGGRMSWNAVPGAVQYSYCVYDDGPTTAAFTTGIDCDIDAYLEGLLAGGAIQNTGVHTIKLEAYDAEMYNVGEDWLGDYRYLSPNYPRFEEQEGTVTLLRDSVRLAADGTLSWTKFSNLARRYWYGAGPYSNFTDGLSVNIYQYIDRLVSEGELPNADSFTISLTANKTDGTQLDRWETTISYTPRITRIDVADISSTTSGIEGEYAYTGQEIRPVPSLVQVRSKALTEGVDYTLSYRNNVEPGTGYAVISGIGRYTGVMEIAFTIVPGQPASQPEPQSEPQPAPQPQPEPQQPAVTVHQVSVARKGSNGTVSFAMGELMQLSPDFATASGWTVTGYASSKPGVATVDQNGLVTPRGEGKTKITIVTANKKKAKLKVQVIDPFKPTAIAIGQGKSVTLAVGETLALSPALAPASARSALTWTSRKPNVAAVDANGVVTALTEGKARITVSTYNRKKATIAVRVVDPHKPAGIAIGQGKSVTLKVGETLALSAALTPESARSALTWTSRKPAVAAVDGNGVVTALKKGKSKITVSTYNKKKATITVKVVE